MFENHFVISFNDGGFWLPRGNTQDINDAWVFNNATRAEGCIRTNDLKDCEVREVSVSFSKLPSKHNLEVTLVD